MDCCKANPPDRLWRSPVEAVKSYAGVKYVARDGSGLMLRGSGTEPILRIYAEARSEAEARRLLQAGVKMTRAVSGPPGKGHGP
jgi:phosphomannomutase